MHNLKGHTIVIYKACHYLQADHYNMLVIGLPNVGKSSLINAWRAAHLKKGDLTHTSYDQNWQNINV